MYDKEVLGQLLKVAQGKRSLNEYARATGVSAGYISKLIRGLNKQAPSPQILEKLANESVGVTYADLMEACGHIVPIDLDGDSNLIEALYTSKVSSDVLRDTEKLLKKFFESCSEEELQKLNNLLVKLDKNQLLDFLNFMNVVDDYKEIKKLSNPIPIFTDKLASLDLLNQKNILAYTPSYSIDHSAYLKISNDEMYPLINEGMYLALNETDVLKEGETFAFTQIKKLKIIVREVILIGGKYYLVPMNRNYESHEYDPDAFKLIGRVDYVIKRL